MAFNASEVFDFALELAKKAGEKIREGFGSEKHVEFKSSAIDLVTQFDRAVEELLFGSIRDRYPSHKLIGEESTAGSDSGINALTDEPTWIIDPIDGTLNFVHSFPHVCVSIGVTVNKKPVIGIIYNPILEHMYAAREGAGATLNGEPIKVSRSVDLDTSLVFLEIGHYQDTKRQEVTMANLTNFLPKVRGLRCVGAAALQMCLVAQGGADAYCSFGIHCWDMAAGVVIVREAGGHVCDTEGGELDLMSRRFLCTSTPELSGKMVAELVQYTALPRDD